MVYGALSNPQRVASLVIVAVFRQGELLVVLGRSASLQISIVAPSSEWC